MPVPNPNLPVTRFDLRLNGEGDIIQMKAFQGHSLAAVDPRLLGGEEICEENDNVPDHIDHGSFYLSTQVISQTGLWPGGRINEIWQMENLGRIKYHSDWAKSLSATDSSGGPNPHADRLAIHFSEGVEADPERMMLPATVPRCIGAAISVVRYGLV